jgi:hypothetical protein
LNVVVYAVSGVLGLAFLLRSLHRLSFLEHGRRELPPPMPEALVGESSEMGARGLDPRPGRLIPANPGVSEPAGVTRELIARDGRYRWSLGA